MAKENFKLDSNIDGTVINDEKVTSIDNMIQVVGETDGPQSYPSDPSPGATFSENEIESFSKFENLTSKTNQLGHGVLYNKEGVPYAYKGDLVFRDGLGNETTLRKMSGYVSSIKEESQRVLLRDNSLQEFNTSNIGVDIDSVIDKSIRNTVSSDGNIVQTASNTEINSSSVSVVTVDLSETHAIWIFGHASVNKRTKIQVRDVTTDTVLTTGFVRHNDIDGFEIKPYLSPVNVSWIGGLETPTAEEVKETCRKVIWDSLLKCNFISKEIEVSNIHEIAIEVVSSYTDEELEEFGEGFEEDLTFETATINIVCMDLDKEDNVVVDTGNLLFNGETNNSVEFDVEMPSEDYSISLNGEQYNEFWYSDKSQTGFTVNCENGYVGNVVWRATFVRD